MKLKANLHFHTGDDPCDRVPYSLKDGIIEAERLGFQVLAITLHGTVFDVSAAQAFASAHGILLISGIEVKVRGKHVVIIGAHNDAENIRSFSDITTYRRNHPESFILAPHPYHLFHSLGKYLAMHIDLFDGIELSWFYSASFDINKKAALIAKDTKKPFIATSDTHFLQYMDESYCIIDAIDASQESIVASLRNGRFENISSGGKGFFTLIYIWIKYLLLL